MEASCQFSPNHDTMDQLRARLKERKYVDCLMGFEAKNCREAASKGQGRSLSELFEMRESEMILKSCF
jgi:hypothetical protein